MIHMMPRNGEVWNIFLALVAASCSFWNLAMIAGTGSANANIPLNIEYYFLR